MNGEFCRLNTVSCHGFCGENMLLLLKFHPAPSLNGVEMRGSLGEYESDESFVNFGR